MRGNSCSVIVMFASVLVLATCSDNDTSGITVTQRFAATLSGASSRPAPITTAASGTATFTYVSDIKTRNAETRAPSASSTC